MHPSKSCLAHPDVQSLTICEGCDRGMCDECWTHDVNQKPWCDDCIRQNAEALSAIVPIGGTALIALASFPLIHALAVSATARWLTWLGCTAFGAVAFSRAAYLLN